MRIEILGCSAGIGGKLRTSCLLVDQDILIDCGTGAGDLSLPRLIAIEHVFLTHSHLDHTALLPMLADVPGRASTLTVHALLETAANLKAHVFNGVLWPDYTSQPTPERPYLRFETFAAGEAIAIGDRKITALPTRHSVAAAGFLLEGRQGGFAYSGDTTYFEPFWEALNRCDRLRYLMIETTFLDDNAARAETAGHMTPALLKKGLKRLRNRPEILITHLEPGRERQTMHELQGADPRPQQLEQGRVFEL